MGLAERRAAAAFEKDRYPALKKEIDAALGRELPIEVAWTELAKDGFQDSYDVAFSSNFFVPLKKAIEAICADDLGKGAFAERVKKVEVLNKRPWSSLEVTLDGTTLRLDADPSYDRDGSCVEDYTKRIVSLLESKL